jgi:hypothetical protein
MNLYIEPFANKKKAKLTGAILLIHPAISNRSQGWIIRARRPWAPIHARAAWSLRGQILKSSAFAATLFFYRWEELFCGPSWAPFSPGPFATDRSAQKTIWLPLWYKYKTYPHQISVNWYKHKWCTKWTAWFVWTALCITIASTHDKWIGHNLTYPYQCLLPRISKSQGMIFAVHRSASHDTSAEWN